LDAHPDKIGAGETEIALIARSIIKLRRYIAPQREALARFAASDAPFIGKGERFALREIANRTTRSVEDLDTIRERLASLRAHIDGLNAARIGRNGFVLSIVAAIFLPLGFLTGLFGVNLAGMPGGSWPGAFAALCAGTVVLGVALWFFFRWKRWF
jgi:zinc transporter